MIAYLMTLVCLLVEGLMTLPPLRYLWRKGCNWNDLPSRRVACSTDSTSSVCTGSSDSSEDSDWEDSLSSFLLQEITQALSGSGATLTLTNFVERSRDTRDAMALANWIQHRKLRRWHSLHFDDTVNALQFRRWNYKKTGLYRHILRVAQAQQIPVTFHATLQVDVDQVSPQALVSVLGQVQTDLDIKSLVLRGTLNPRDAEMLALALVALLSKDKRGWKTVDYRVQVGGDRPREAQLVHKICLRAIQKVAHERYISVKF